MEVRGILDAISASVSGLTSDEIDEFYRSSMVAGFSWKYAMLSIFCVEVGNKWRLNCIKSGNVYTSLDGRFVSVGGNFAAVLRND